MSAVARRTYWHLEGLGRKPNEYDIVTSKLLFYPERGFEVDTPIAEWYAKYQKASALRCKDWEAFRDPRETTYTRYTELQKAKETFVDGLLNVVDATGYDAAMSLAWRMRLERVLPVLRYPVHGLQMIAAYVGQMAPAGRVVITCALQAADEMRRIQRCAYRMRQIQQTRATFGDAARTLWQDDPVWQPLRQVIECLLVTYDFSEAFVALNLVLKPAFDELFMTHFARLAASQGDEVLSQIFLSLNEDCAWHREWSTALAATLIRDDAANEKIMRGFADRWHEPVMQAMRAFEPVFSEGLERFAPCPFETILLDLDRACTPRRAIATQVEREF
jgi:toluene monooxygenase system protein E